MITGKKAPRNDYAECFSCLKETLQQPGNARGISGLSAFEACQSALLDDHRFTTASQVELARFYTLIHIFIGVMAESRCFAAFAFWAGFFGRVTDPAALERMKKIGEAFMDTHNQCWGAWAAMGKDHISQPELYLDQFMASETRRKLVETIGNFKGNDEKAIRALEEISANYPANSVS